MKPATRKKRPLKRRSAKAPAKSGAKQNLHPTLFQYRYRFVVFALCAVFLAIVGRAAYIQVISPDRLIYEGDMRSLRTQTREVQRGLVTDRNGEMLAVSVPAEAIWADPKVLNQKNSFADSRRWQALAEVVGEDADTLAARLKANPKRRFVYLKRQVTPALARYVRELKIAGIGLKPESRRYYPAGEITAQLVGITNIDDKGLEGLERQYDDWLTGSASKRRVRKSRDGKVVENLSVIEEGENPNDLKLSIDMRLQSLAYEELKKATEYHMASSGSIVILDVATSEVLAMVNTPSYNPNQRAGMQSFAMRNRAVTDTFEPGSTVKPLVVATALAEGVTEPAEVINTSPGYRRIGGSMVRDTRNFGKLDIAHVLLKSSNMGTSNLALRMDIETLLDSYAGFGIGEYSGINLPGESTGVLSRRHRWSDFERATLSFGYGLSATPLQVARMYAILGNGGRKNPVSILKVKPDQMPPAEQVIPEWAAEEVVSMLSGITGPEGTAKRAHIDGYTVAGKTGTSRKAIAGGYGDDFVTFFAGLAPAERPRLAISVVINDPKGEDYYGGTVAAPVFAKVMSGALQMLNVAPVSDKERAGNLVARRGGANDRS
ncbi:penicillin-binding transpeptidase domain-containing protein [Ferrimonas sp. YFM]|uniref:penicillin-binding transpeptidase domain-containing protein n=1 Tax=Ferrimonas sp. YFM TaxID=3028878 RepID=UPI0025746463|nr:penicillin-binding transpeptidase domain-containing protein [Ferrimonas sp. YFM]BDY06684.1 peptidoglycan glycosyltransferase FtsI [Ferrimonas sp. YFM]